MDTTARTSSRDFEVDALKGLAIACVVFGHAVLRNLPNHADSWAYLLVASFEMPLFMFLSGYVLAGRVRSPRLAWLGKRAVRLMVPFVVWQSIFHLSLRIVQLWQQVTSGETPLFSALGEVASGWWSYVLWIVGTPTPGLWYLPALLVCSAVLAVLYPLSKYRWGGLAILVLGAAVMELLGTGRSSLGIVQDFGLLKTLTLWPVFAAGFAWAHAGRTLQLSPRGARWLAVAAFPFIAVPAMRAIGDLSGYSARAAKAVLGLLGTASSTVGLAYANRAAQLLRLDRLGQLTMGIYCSHWLFLRVEFAVGWVGVFAAFVFTLGGAILTTLAIRRFPRLAWLLLGEGKPLRRGGSTASRPQAAN